MSIPPENLIFQNLPIHWIGGDFFWPLCGAICGSLLVWIFLSFMRKSEPEKILQKNNTHTIIFTENDIFRNDFETYTLNILKKKLETIHIPNATRAHTRKDIRKYITDATILDLFSRLESAEYEGTSLTKKERENVIQMLHNI